MDAEQVSGARRPSDGSLVCADCGSDSVSPDGYCEQCGLRQPNGREHIEIELAAPGALPGAEPGTARVSRVWAAGVSDRGLRRERNEDAIAMAALPEAVCAVVCDGVASAPRSEAAAQLAAETATAVLAESIAAGIDPLSATRAAAARAGEAVANLSSSRNLSPACTFVSAIVEPALVTLGWIGDSRAYWLARPQARPDAVPPAKAPSEPGDRTAGPGRSAGGSSRTVPDVAGGDASGVASDLLTLDDSWAVRMIARGEMSEDAVWADRRAHQLTAWLGADAGVPDPHVRAFRPRGPGLVLICSDGLWNDLPEPAALADVALTGDGEPAADPLGSARRLVRAALDAGGHDNVTAAVIPFPPPSEPTREPGT